MARTMLDGWLSSGAMRSAARASRKAARRLASRDRWLAAVGLRARTPAGDLVTGLGLFAVGVLAGAALGLAFAPRRGTEIRALVGSRLRRRGDGLGDVPADLGAEAAVSPGLGAR